ncbi:hypothetical protein [uncultured Ilyobacter sp.]
MKVTVRDTLEKRRKVNIFDGQVLISVAIEDVEDLIEDLDQGLKPIK